MDLVEVGTGPPNLWALGASGEDAEVGEDAGHLCAAAGNEERGRGEDGEEEAKGYVFFNIHASRSKRRGEKLSDVCAVHRTRHVAFPQKLTLPMVIQTIRGTRIKLWWSTMFRLSSLGIDRTLEV
jgi:hypothetical protein